MKIIQTLLLSLLGCATLMAADKPNVIVILADDLGYGDIGCFGALPEHVRTSTMDRLASEGLRFTDAHTPSSVCTPSRYSLLTGEYAFRNRLADGIIAGDAPLSITPGSFTPPGHLRNERSGRSATGPDKSNGRAPATIEEIHQNQGMTLPTTMHSHLARLRKHPVQ